MCGIIAVAILSREFSRDIKPALDSLRHRGPDNDGKWTSPSGEVILGHRRLSIIDLSETGRQPMHNEDKSIWLTCNGEIYNFLGLRSRLEGLGHSFYSNSDSEVIIHAYEQWSNKCVDYLEGMFAFAIWDENKKELFAARDRVGIKPLCYALIPGGIALASDLRALLPLLSEKPYPSPEAVAYVMILGYIPSPLAVWKGTYKLKPGHSIRWSKNTGIRISKYWSPPSEIDYLGDYSQNKWDELFSTVLHDHLLSDVPLGFFLSGGLDSTTLAVGLHDLGVSIKALTISFPSSPLNEEPIATMVTKHLNQKHVILPLKSYDIDHLLDDVAAAYDEPIGYSALLTMYAISKLASDEFKAVLAGDGGDECFGGYIWHRAKLPNQSKTFSTLISILRRNLGLTGHTWIDRYLKSLYTGPGFLPLQKYSWYVSARFLPEEAEYLMAPTGLRFDDERWILPLAEHFAPRLPLLRSLQRVDLMTFCSECILPKVDRASMWHSLEVRVPFLDRRIIEWGLQKPVEDRELIQANSKPVLREFLRSKVPKGVLNHSKQGFSLKIKSEYNWNLVFDQIENSWWVQNGFWRKDWHKIINTNISPKKGRAWFLIMLTKWAQKWLN